MIKKITVISIFLILIFNGCTWTPKSVLPKYFQVIYISPMENLTMEPEIEDILYRKTKTEFEMDGRLIVTDHVAKANGILFCTITEYKKTPISYSDKGEIDGNFLQIKVHLKLRDIKTGKWLHDKELTSSIKYYLISEPVETELEAQKRIISNLANKIVSKVIEGW